MTASKTELQRANALVEELDMLNDHIGDVLKYFEKNEDVASEPGVARAVKLLSDIEDVNDKLLDSLEPILD